MGAIRFALRHVATIIVVVNMIESIADESVPGAKKKALAMDMLVKTFDQLGIKLSAGMIRVMDEVIDISVALFNALGWGDSVGDALRGDVGPETFDAALKEPEPEPDEPTTERWPTRR